MLRRIQKAIADPAWFRERLAYKISFPEGPATRALAKLRVVASRFSERKVADSILFCYDLAINPITFDFVESLAQAEQARRHRGLCHLDVVFVTNDDEGRLPPTDHFGLDVTHVQRLFRIHDVLAASCRLVKSVRNVAVVNRDLWPALADHYAFRYPEGYHSLSPVSCGFVPADAPENFFPMIDPPDQALKLMREYIDRFNGRRIVTITLREYSYISGRNSRIDDWIQFADSLPAEYVAVFVPDASSYSSQFREMLFGHEVVDSVCWNVTLRAALYRLSWANLGVAGGPLITSLYQEDANTLQFLKVEEYPADYSDQLHSHYGDVKGNKRPYLRWNNHYVWQTDLFDNIAREFREFDQRIVDSVKNELHPV